MYEMPPAPRNRVSGTPADVCGEQLMNESLIADSRAGRLDAQGAQDVRVEANRDQHTRRMPERRPADAPRTRQLLVAPVVPASQASAMWRMRCGLLSISATPHIHVYAVHSVDAGSVRAAAAGA